jgi:hypothetical protein
MTAPAMTPVHAPLVRVLRVGRSSGRREGGPEVGAAVSRSGGFRFGSRDSERGVRSGSVLSTLPDLPHAGGAQLLSGGPLAGNRRMVSGLPDRLAHRPAPAARATLAVSGTRGAQLAPNALAAAATISS